MNQKEFDILVQKTIASTADLLVSKGREYAGTEDRLSNFKRGANLTGATPLQVAFIYASKHYDSIATYVRETAADRGLVPNLSEPIEGRFDDLINYMILMKAIVVEQQKERSNSTGQGNSFLGGGTVGAFQSSPVNSAFQVKTVNHGVVALTQVEWDEWQKSQRLPDRITATQKPPKESTFS